MSADTLVRMNEALIRRGPDEGGAFQESGVGLAMRRLSIIDLAGGHQPIANEDSTVWVVFNGEIYNYRELRERLRQRGHSFNTNSDTEVIVHLYEEYGDDLVDHLQGMFAFSLWDVRRRRGLIARDRLGIKPLFFSQVGDTLLFGSEIKSILASGIVRKDIDYQALDAFFAYTYIPAPLTIYRSIRKLDPGCLLTYESGRIELRRYWDVDFTRTDLGANEQQFEEKFDKAIEEAVVSHLVSDVPLGAFLSGGIDSGLVVARMAEHLNEPVRTFTMGFGGSRSALIDERPLAAMLAKRYGCQYQDFVAKPDFREMVGEIVDAFDEPFADDSVIPSYLIYQHTRKHVKVALSGLGGDELFAGYNRYSGVLISEYYSRFMPGSLHRHLIYPVLKRMPESKHGGERVDHAKRFSAAALLQPAERYLSFVSTIPSIDRHRLYSRKVSSQIDYTATDRIMTDPYTSCHAPDEVSRALYVDLKTYLPEDILALSDRLSMWHSLEVRVPLVDHRLVELSAQLPTKYKINWKRKKILLRRIAERYLPNEILNHRKQGFESPMAAWLRTDLADYAREVLSPNQLQKSGLFDETYVSDRLIEHQTGRRKNNKLIFSMIMFQEWYARHVNC